MTELLRCSPKEAPIYLASKFLHFELLIEKEDFDRFFEALGEVFLFSTLGVQLKGQNAISKERFLATWQDYIDDLRHGKAIDDSKFRFAFTLLLTSYNDALRAIAIGDDKEIITPYEPAIQLQLHRFGYSTIDGKFRPMVFGEKSVSWGVRLSYPQLFQYPETRQVMDALDEEKFPNAKLFNSLRYWIRHNTQAVPFLVEGKRVNIPMRISKGCFSWINNHKELIDRGLSILV